MECVLSSLLFYQSKQCKCSYRLKIVEVDGQISWTGDGNGGGWRERSLGINGVNQDFKNIVLDIWVCLV